MNLAESTPDSLCTVGFTWAHVSMYAVGFTAFRSVFAASGPDKFSQNNRFLRTQFRSMPETTVLTLCEVDTDSL